MQSFSRCRRMIGVLHRKALSHISLLSGDRYAIGLNIETGRFHSSTYWASGLHFAFFGLGYDCSRLQLRLGNLTKPRVGAIGAVLRGPSVLEESFMAESNHVQLEEIRRIQTVHTRFRPICGVRQIHHLSQTSATSHSPAPKTPASKHPPYPATSAPRHRVSSFGSIRNWPRLLYRCRSSDLGPTQLRGLPSEKAGVVQHRRVHA